jgi:hypothetical protein
VSERRGDQRLVGCAGDGLTQRAERLARLAGLEQDLPLQF